MVSLSRRGRVLMTLTFAAFLLAAGGSLVLSEVNEDEHASAGPAQRESAQRTVQSTKDGRLRIETEPQLEPMPDSRRVTAAATIETGQGFDFVVDSVDVSEQAGLLSVTYHVEGDTANLRGVGFALAAVDGNGNVRALGGSPMRAFAGEPMTVQAPLSELLDSVIYLPSAVRVHAEETSIEIPEAAVAAWRTSVVLGGEELEVVAQREGEFIDVLITGPPGGQVVIDGRLVGHSLSHAGSPLDPYHAGGTYPTQAGTGSDPQKRLTWGLTFYAPVDTVAGDLVLVLAGYGELIRSDWTIPLP